MTIPVVSTQHAPENHMELLKENKFWLASYPEGAFIYVGDSEHWEGCAPEFVSLFSWFNENFEGEGWLRLDSGGDVIDGLPVWEW